MHDPDLFFKRSWSTSEGKKGSSVTTWDLHRGGADKYEKCRDKPPFDSLLINSGRAKVKSREKSDLLFLAITGSWFIAGVNSKFSLNGRKTSLYRLPHKNNNVGRFIQWAINKIQNVNISIGSYNIPIPCEDISSVYISTVYILDRPSAHLPFLFSFPFDIQLQAGGSADQETPATFGMIATRQLQFTILIY